MDSTKLKLTEHRRIERHKDKERKEELKDVLHFDSQPTTTISASLEDLKGEYEDCDITENDVYSDDVKQYLSSSQPARLNKFESECILLPKPLRKSDSVLCAPYNKHVNREFERQMSEDDTDSDVFVITPVRQTKSTDVEVHSGLETINLKERCNTENQWNCCEQAASAFASGSEKEEETISKVKTLQVGC